MQILERGTPVTMPPQWPSGQHLMPDAAQGVDNVYQWKKLNKRRYCAAAAGERPS